MKVKLTNFEIEMHLLNLNNIDKTIKFPIKVSYAILKNSRTLDSSIKEYNDLKRELVEKYGTDDGKGGYYIEANSAESKMLLEELTPIGEIEHEIDIFMVSMSLFDQDSFHLNLDELIKIDFMLED